MTCREIHQVSFEWTVSGLRELFDLSVGSAKSRVHKSPRFGKEGQWQILLYPNAGTSGKENHNEGQYASLFLSSEPTAEELESAIMRDGVWMRDGIYKFSFEIRTIKRQVLFGQKEASNHVFSRKTANWGWAQFARRDVIFYGSPVVRTDDTFVICCTITSSAVDPSPPPPQLMQSVPKSLLMTLGGMLDDPRYCDICFHVIDGKGKGRKVYASRKMLERAEYFQAMFSSDFVEGYSTTTSHSVDSSTTLPPPPPLVDNTSEVYGYSHEHEEPDDSDYESDFSTEDYVEDAKELVQPPSSDVRNSAVVSSQEEIPDPSPPLPPLPPPIEDTNELKEEERNVRQKITHPSSPGSGEPLKIQLPISDDKAKSSKDMLRVTIRDASFATFYSILYYLYTDLIYFAPLSSTFAASASPPLSSPSLPPSWRKPRKEWISNFAIQYPGVPVCSAKACYRLADRFGLNDLKVKASQYIRQSLTCENIVLEIFSPFTAMFGDIRQFQVEFFLSNWHTIRSSTAMQQVWKQIRWGRHPGYEEVWPVIAMNLEFKPQNDAVVPGGISVSVSGASVSGNVGGGGGEGGNGARSSVG